MPTPSPFSQWLSEWLDVNRHTMDQLAAKMGNTGAMVSKWVNGITIPDAKTLLKLAEITGANHWYLAELAWGWPGVPPSDDLLKNEGVKEVARMYDDIRDKSPELAEDFREVGRALQRLAVRRRRQQGGEV